jgi:adenylate cyclase
VGDRGPSTDGDRPANTFLSPGWMAAVHLVLWGTGVALAIGLYGAVNTRFIPGCVFGFGFSGHRRVGLRLPLDGVRTASHGRADACGGRRAAAVHAGIMGRALSVWPFGSGISMLGILTFAVFRRSVWHLTALQFTSAVIVLTLIPLVTRLFLTWILSWLTATPVRGVRAALRRVEQGTSTAGWWRSMPPNWVNCGADSTQWWAGCANANAYETYSGRHVGREVAQAAEHQQIQLGGEEHCAAVLFVDIMFFAVIVEEVNLRRGLVNKLQGVRCWPCSVRRSNSSSPRRRRCPQHGA